MTVDRRPTNPVCKAFLLCRDTRQDGTGETSLLGLAKSTVQPSYPAAVPIKLLARFSSGHGDYELEMRVHDMKGEDVWAHRVPYKFPMPDPTHTYDVILGVEITIPSPGRYDVALFANGKEVSRELFLCYAIAPLPDQG